MDIRWIVQKSHKVNMPNSIDCANLDELRQSLQDLANTYIATDEHPSLGELEFRYELDDGDEPFIVHAYFYNKYGDRSRFARLVRDDDV
jgi:hypothetical protein